MLASILSRLDLISLYHRSVTVWFWCVPDLHLCVHQRVLMTESLNVLFRSFILFYFCLFVCHILFNTNPHRVYVMVKTWSAIWIGTIFKEYFFTNKNFGYSDSVDENCCDCFVFVLFVCYLSSSGASNFSKKKVSRSESLRERAQRVRESTRWIWFVFPLSFWGDRLNFFFFLLQLYRNTGKSGNIATRTFHHPIPGESFAFLNGFSPFAFLLPSLPFCWRAEFRRRLICYSWALLIVVLFQSGNPNWVPILHYDQGSIMIQIPPSFVLFFLFFYYFLLLLHLKKK